MRLRRELDLRGPLEGGASVLLLGPRGVGKTVLARETLASLGAPRMDVNLLDPDLYQRYLRSPGQLREDVAGKLRRQQRLVVFIDEIQKVPALLDVVQLLYDEGNVQFLLTGSSARKLKRGGANLLGGRLQALALHPLTCREHPETDLLLGSLPGVVLGHPNPAAALRSYIHLYLKEEVLEESLVRKVEAFARFLELAGHFHGEPLNASALARDAGVSSKTVQEYFQILEDTLLVHRLPGWSASARKQLRSAPRYYLFDNGVASALRGELKLELSPRTSHFGRLFEARVVQEAFRLNAYRELDLKLSYWQNNHGLEVDLVVSRGVGPPLAGLEIKSSTAPDDWAALRSFRQDHPQVPIYCLCRTPFPYRSEDGVEVLPWQDGLEVLTRL